MTPTPPRHDRLASRRPAVRAASARVRVATWFTVGVAAITALALLVATFAPMALADGEQRAGEQPAGE